MNTTPTQHYVQSFPAVALSSRAARQFTSALLREHGAADSVVADYGLVVSELTANAIEYGNNSTLSVHVDVSDPQWWCLEVVSGMAATSAHLLHPDVWNLAAGMVESGRGLGIVRQLIDHIEVRVVDGLLSVRCRTKR